MTPSARLSAAIAVLDRILGGEPAEKALTNWGRASRFAGSGDRHAVRDLVYDSLRCRRSFAALGGGETGRGLVLGGMRAAGIDPATLFDGVGHAPAPLSDADRGRTPAGPEALDCPDWLFASLALSLGADAAPVLQALRQRAPVFLRVNLARASREDAIARLASEGISAKPSQLASSALQVTDNARKIQTSSCYLDGLVELQDASSQAVIEALPLKKGMRVLDLCAGGGGKSLAIAAAAKVQVFAHDKEIGRMKDLSARAHRANAAITKIENPESSAPYDLVLADVPCSGSGSWRRDPQGKWALTAAKLAALKAVQEGILSRAAGLVAPSGYLAYATCSLLRAENEDLVEGFIAHERAWECLSQRRFSPLQGADGFFVAVLTRKT